MTGDWGRGCETGAALEDDDGSSSLSLSLNSLALVIMARREVTREFGGAIWAFVLVEAGVRRGGELRRVKDAAVS